MKTADFSEQEAPEVDANGSTLEPPVAKRLGDLVLPDFDDADELIERRFLCRGGGLLIVGPTGIGKSALAMQLIISCALGKPLFGITPTRPLKCLLIQAENDDGDLAEMRDGVIKGMDLTDSEKEYVYENVIVVHEDSRTGMFFCKSVLRPLLEEHRPDLVWIDPALAFLGGDTISQKDVGDFLRHYLNPLLREFECAAVIVHHTNKPPSGQQKPNWQAGDFAYLGSGSAEWSNWPRAILGMRSTGSHSVFELMAGKRGRRLGWKEADGVTRAYSKYIAHSKEEGVICWRDAEPDEIPVSESSKADSGQLILSLVPVEGHVAKDTIIYRAKLNHGIGKNKALDTVKALVAEGKLHEWRIPRPGNRPQIHLCRSTQPAESTQVDVHGRFNGFK